MRDQMAMIADRWLLVSRQIVNWGSYDGWHEFRPACDETMPVTLLTGASESGKSTLVDAQTSLLYPAGTPLNKASNTGRSERSDYTYVRGMLGFSGEYDEPHYLRGRTAQGTPVPVWSAIVDTYRNRNGGSMLSCAKFLYLPAGERREQLRRWYVTRDAAVDPRRMDEHRDTPFTAAMLRDTYPGCDVFSNAEAFHARIWTIMGLNADACRLLHRMQSADAPSRLDDIFKQGVLGVPAALGHAQDAVNDWDRYNANFHDMDLMERRAHLLDTIHEQYAAYQQAASALQAVRAVDPDSDRGMATISSHAQRWMREEVERQLPGARRRVSTAHSTVMAVTAQITRLEQHAADLDVQIQHAGGTALERIQERLHQARQDAQDAVIRHDHMAALFAQAGEPMPADADQWQTACATMSDVAATYAQRMDELDEQRTRLLNEQQTARAAVDMTQADLQRARQRRTRINADMEHDRALLAHATGLSPDDLPYAAELMDVDGDAEDWRTAMNVVYGSLARTILVDARHEPGFAAAVSRIPRETMHRRTWRFIDTARLYGTDAQTQHRNRHSTDTDGVTAVTQKTGGADAAAAYLSDRLVYDEDSPFTPWLRAQVTAPDLDARCVDRIDDSDHRTRQIQRDGQLKSGDRSWHGTRGLTGIIGFASDHYLAALRTDAAAAEHTMRQTAAAITTLKAAVETLQARRALADQMAFTTWQQIDVTGCRQRVDALSAQLDKLTAHAELSQLAARQETVRSQLEQARQELARATMEEEQARQAVAALCAWLENGRQAQNEADGAMPYRADLREAYDLAFGAFDAEERVHALAGTRQAPGGGFAAQVIRVMADRMRSLTGEARERVEARRRDVEREMAAYCAQYDAGDTVSATVDDIAFYEDERQEVARLTIHTAADDEYANCLDKLLSDYTMLKGDVSSDRQTISEQLERINTVLRGKPFGPRNGELSLHATVTGPNAAFLRELQHAIRCIAQWQQQNSRDRATMKTVFDACRPLTDLLRGELAAVQPQANGVRDYGARNLDPRCRSRFYAIVQHADGREERIDTTGGKSGGALQELTSFVYGAALIYVLGGGLGSEPTYATVFLDEALIKADSRYTRRALSVLPKLGFQVIVSAPESKTAEIMEVASRVYVAQRDRNTDCSHLEMIERMMPDETTVEQS